MTHARMHGRIYAHTNYGANYNQILWELAIAEGGKGLKIFCK